MQVRGAVGERDELCECVWPSGALDESCVADLLVDVGRKRSGGGEVTGGGGGEGRHCS